MSAWALPVAAVAARIRACIALPDALHARERIFDAPRHSPQKRRIRCA